MLVLARGKRQRIFIGEDVIIEVLSIRGDTVRLGIAAPGDVEIWREELIDRGLQTPRKQVDSC